MNTLVPDTISDNVYRTMSRREERPRVWKLRDTWRKRTSRKPHEGHREVSPRRTSSSGRSPISPYARKLTPRARTSKVTMPCGPHDKHQVEQNKRGMKRAREGIHKMREQDETVRRMPRKSVF